MIKKGAIFFCLSLNVLFAEPMEQAFEKAQSYYKADEFEHAIDSFEQAQKLAKSSVQKSIINYNLATSYLRMNQVEKAIDILEPLTQSKEELPSYLYERCGHNLLIAQLKNASNLLNEDLGNFNEKHLLQASSSLDQAQKLYEQFHLESSQRELSDANRSIPLLIKELKCRLDKKSKAHFLNELELESALDVISKRLDDLLNFYEQIEEKKLSDSLSQYFLSQRYAKERQTRPIWDRTRELVENQETSKRISKAFHEGHNDFLSSLDAMKEGGLWVSSFRGSKAKLLIELVDLELKDQDVIDHCLEKRIELSKLCQKKDAQVSYIGLQHRRLKHVRHLLNAYLDDFDSKDHPAFALIIDELKKNLKTGPNLSVLYHDLYLYRELKESPLEYLYSLYQKLFDSFEYRHEDIAVMDAACTYFDKHCLAYQDDSKKTKYQRASETLLESKNQIVEKNFSEGRHLIEDFFTHYDFAHFTYKEIELFSDLFQTVLKSKMFLEPQLKGLKSRLSHSVGLRRSSDLTTESFQIKKQTDPGFEEALLSTQLERLTDDIETKEILISYGSRWMNRLKMLFETEMKNANEILKDAIQDEELSLKFSQKYPELTDADFEATFLTMSQKAQIITLKVAEQFPEQYKKELSSQDPKKITLDDAALGHFEQGYQYAQDALKALSARAIDWSKVVKLQEQTIECWKKVFENQNSPEGSSGSSGGSSQQEEQNYDQSSEPDLEEMQSSKESEQMMDLLEKLSEMQQDDQLLKPKQKSTKAGLRPW